MNNYVCNLNEELPLFTHVRARSRGPHLRKRGKDEKRAKKNRTQEARGVRAHEGK